MIRVKGQCNQGGRDYMEDVMEVSLIPGQEDSFFAIFDGHGGREAADFAKNHLWHKIKQQKGFYSEDKAQIVKAIKEGFVNVQKEMWKYRDSWRRTRHGLPSTSGTTATVVILKGRMLYIAHVGDSSAALGRLNQEKQIQAVGLTSDHKPDVPSEKSRIESVGGKVLYRHGVPRVAWERPVKKDHKGPIRRSTQLEWVPFLAVSRALGDLWSFDYYRSEYIVSPVPDVRVHKLTPGVDKFLIIASDGLWDVMTVDEAVKFVHNYDNDDICTGLIQHALRKWRRGQTADNTSVVVVFFDDEADIEPPGKK